MVAELQGDRRSGACQVGREVEGLGFDIAPRAQACAVGCYERRSGGLSQRAGPFFEYFKCLQFVLANYTVRDILRNIFLMKPEIHPEYRETVIVCACGATYRTRSTRENIKIGICAACHPFFTGEQKFVDTAGRVDKFQRRYGSVRAPRAVKKA